MKFNKIFLSMVACSVALASCDDQVMEWKTPEGHNSITSSEIPLNLAEKIANYDYIKAYAAQYMPQSIIGLGFGVDKYLNDETARSVVDTNFQMFTTGNAMKHSSVVKNNGTLDFTTIDTFLETIPADMKVYGHNFLWHTQQKQTYLKTLIAPEMKIETSGDDVCENVVTNSGFEEGTSGWTGLWGKYSYEIVQPGHESDNAIHFTISNECQNMWDAQLFWSLGTYLEAGVTYAYSFWVKSDCGLTVQVIGQNASYSGIYKDMFTPGTDWTLCEGEFTYNEGDTENIERMGIQFGGEAGSQLWVDDFKFGKKIENKDPMINVLGDNGKFESEDAVNAWGCWGGNSPVKSISAEGEGYESNFALKLENPVDGGAYSEWKAQCAYDFSDYLVQGKTYVIQFYAKCSNVGTVQFQYQNGSTYGSQGGYSRFEVGTDWMLCEAEITVDYEDVNRILLNLGAYAGTYWIDNVKFGEKIEQSAARSVSSRAGGITYIYKTAEEKKEILLSAMEEWIQGIAEHVEAKVPGRVVAWDVINEPISDNCKWRGIDGAFMDDDTEPVEDNGLTLNWGDDHWYWGYYIGKEYAVKAFEYARKYCNPDTKLFVNDYNLETNPSKLAELIAFVNYIEENGQTVDGIGTQMHVSTSITRAEVDAMFKTMAATGKLVRVTELDVRLGTATPSAGELETQANTYRMIFESFKENVPVEQQAGITIWGLTDAADEHEYWLPDESPNLFDANYGRKHAYKGVCDGIAGKDISEEFTGDDWKNAYE